MAQDWFWMSGTGHSTFDIAASGDPRIDGILGARGWDDPVVTYAFPTSKAEYGNYGAGEDEGQVPFSAAMQLATARILDADLVSAARAGFTAEAFLTLAIDATTQPAAHVRLSQTTLDPYNFGTAWGYTPATFATSGDVWLSDVLFDYTNPLPGSYAHLTLMHEIGHALGLEHGHENGVFGALPAQYDAMEYSVMTYRSYVGTQSFTYSNESVGFAQSWMMQDIAALQHIYGADYTTNAGDTVYSWSPLSGDTLVDGAVGISANANRIFATIWDGGGIDTYDLSAYATAVTINLAAGASSAFGLAQRAVLDADQVASGNIYNALLFEGDLRALIENANGGSAGDTLLGNQVNNRLIGNDGDDHLVGGAGNDRLQGGADDDRLQGQTDDDLLQGGTGRDILQGGDGKDRLFGNADKDLLFGNDGADSLHGGAQSDTLRGGAGDDLLLGQGGADLIFGAQGKDLLIGSEGNDILYGGAQDDTLRGGVGDDRLNGDEGADVLWGNTGNDKLLGGGGDDILNGGAGDDGLRGGLGNDQLMGGTGNDILSGGTGSDVLNGGSGTDDMTGGAGADMFVFAAKADSQPGAQADRILDFTPGQDQIDLSQVVNGPCAVLPDGSYPGQGPSILLQETAAHTLVSVDVTGNFIIDMNIVLLAASGVTANDFIL